MAGFALRDSSRRIDLPRGRARGSPDGVRNSGSSEARAPIPFNCCTYHRSRSPRCVRTTPCRGDSPAAPPYRWRPPCPPRPQVPRRLRPQPRRSAAARASIGRSRRVARSMPLRFVSISLPSTSRSRRCQGKRLGREDRTTRANNSKRLPAIGSYGSMRIATKSRAPGRVPMRLAQRCRGRCVAATAIPRGRALTLEARNVAAHPC